MTKICIFIIGIVIFGDLPTNLACRSDKDIIENLLKSYDKSKLPNPDGVDVGTALWIQDLVKVDDVNEDVTLDIYLNHRWNDPGLVYSQMDPCSKLNMTLNQDVVSQLWNPNYATIDSKSYEIHRSPMKNVFALIYTNGTVWVNHRTKASIACSMQWSKYPFDQITCKMIVESYSYNTDKVKGFFEAPPLPLKAMETAQFVMDKIDTEVIDPMYPAGRWNELKIEMKLSRRYGWFVFMVYVPTYFIILLCWISVFLRMKILAFRAMLVIVSLLALFFNIGIVTMNTPKIFHIKALDVWLLMSLAFVVAALVELVVVAVLTSDPKETAEDNRQATIIDRLFMIIFPVAFVLFNVVYWAIYLS